MTEKKSPNRLSSSDILASKSTLHPFEHAPWGGTVYLRPISARFRSELEAVAYSSDNPFPPNLRALVLVECCCHEDGQSLFTKDDVDPLMALPANEIDPVYLECQKVSKTFIGAVEDEEKN